MLVLGIIVSIVVALAYMYMLRRLHVDELLAAALPLVVVCLPWFGVVIPILHGLFAFAWNLGTKHQK